MTPAHRPYATAFVEYATRRPDVVCLTGDLTASCEVDTFRDAVPERFFNLGMAEQNMVGIAGGMARAGLVPFVHTFGVFCTRRPYDQVAMAIGVPRLRVRLMGFLPGITTPGGVTHQAIDDVALMRSIPGMTIVDLADATEIETFLPLLDDVEGPVYCRVMRGDVERLFTEAPVLGKVRVLRQGSDVCLISSSILTREARRAAEVLERGGLSVGHLHASTLKPFDDPVVAESVSGARAVLTIENHLTNGGLGSAVAELLAESGVSRPLRRIGLRDTYGGGGSFEYLSRRLMLDAESIARSALELLGASTSDLDLNCVATDSGRGAGDLSRQEAL